MRKPLSQETRDHLRRLGKAQFADPEVRRAHGDLTRAKMAAAGPFIAADLAQLRSAWAKSHPEARRRFLGQLLKPVFAVEHLKSQSCSSSCVADNSAPQDNS
jgi:hypothetical protein